MPTKRVSMHKMKEVIRLHAAGLSLRPIAAAVRLSLGTVAKYVSAAERAKLTWPLPDGLDDAALARLMRGTPPESTAPRREAQPDYPLIHQELKQKGVTLQLLWQEYRVEQGAASYAYSQFCNRYRAWQKTIKRSMRQVHLAGEKLFVDYAGPTMPITDSVTGEISSAQIFVAVLGSSNYTYAEATHSQQLPDWLGSHVRAFEYFAGVPAIVVPDNLKSGVDRACRYEPDLNRSYDELGAHYGVAIIPARPYRPKDKAKAEVAVQIVERWILAALRKHQFFSLAALNTAIAALLVQLNTKPFKKLPGCRLSAYEAIDKPALKPLPATRYEFATWKKVRVNIDYHIEFEGHFYSVPHTLVGKQIDLRVTNAVIECLANSQRVASHVKSPRRGEKTTVVEHMPKSHRAHLEWTPGKLLTWGESMGPSTCQVVQYQLTAKPHPEMGYRACLGLLSLARKYGNDRLEAACRRAVVIDALTRNSVQSILKAGLDRQLPPERADANPIDNATHAATDPLVAAHANVRGSAYYH